MTGLILLEKVKQEYLLIITKKARHAKRKLSKVTTRKNVWNGFIKETLHVFGFQIFVMQQQVLKKNPNGINLSPFKMYILIKISTYVVCTYVPNEQIFN